MDINLKIPTAWNELSDKQTQNICYNLHCMHRSIANVPNQETQIKIITYINLAKELLRENTYKAIRIALKEIQPKAYENWLAYLFNAVALYTFPETIKANTVLYGPAYRLRNLTIEEFSFADAVYFRWKTTSNPKYLNLLCSTLYRKKATEENPIDKRDAFQRFLAEQNVEQFIDLPLKQKLPIAYAFEGSRNHLVSQYPNVFPKPPKSVDPKAKPTPAKYTPFGQLISAKIGYDPSKLKETNNLNCYTFFGIYENELIHLKKQNRKKK